MNASLDGSNSNISEIRKDKHSAVSAVKNNPASRIWRVAVFELAAAIFCTPTNALASGDEPSRASFRPVTSRIICK